jgi:hypothetical protein
VIGTQLQLLGRLFVQPLAAMSGIIDEGSWLFAAAFVFVLSFGRSNSLPTASLVAPLLLLAAAFVPVAILGVCWFAHAGSFGVVARRDYGPLLTCVLMAWAGAHVPATLGAMALPAFLPIWWLVGKLLFVIFALCAVRTLFGASWPASVASVVLASGAVAVGVSLYDRFGGILSFLWSPFVLYFLYRAFASDLSDLGSTFRTRQNMRRQLEMATVNPHDADPHYQLGLIYQQRRQYSEAIKRFERAVEIDPDLTDAHFQLGLMAREQGRLEDALKELTTAVQQDDKHSSSDVWREIGAVHLSAGRLPEAEAALRTFVGRRAYDPQGLYLYGETLEKLGRAEEAQQFYQQCVEAARTAPAHRRGEVRKWEKMARERIK